MEGEETQGGQGLYAPLAKADEGYSATGTRTWKARSLWIGICYADSAFRWPLSGPAERRSLRTVGGALAPQSRAAIRALLRPLFSAGHHDKVKVCD